MKLLCKVTDSVGGESDIVAAAIDVSPPAIETITRRLAAARAFFAANPDAELIAFESPQAWLDNLPFDDDGECDESVAWNASDEIPLREPYTLSFASSRFVSPHSQRFCVNRHLTFWWTAFGGDQRIEERYETLGFNDPDELLEPFDEIARPQEPNR